MTRLTSVLTLALAAGLAQAQHTPGPAGWCGTVIPAAQAESPIQVRPSSVEPGGGQGQSGAPAANVEHPRVEVVFVLDTTGSMSGLIEGAKQTIWSIANAIATGEPHPDIRMGLVGYRDRGDEYVTTLTSLTEDLDAVYSNLMEFEANGGGDGPESVNQALHEAVTLTSWSDDAGVMRLVYLVGDAPPHMDYDQDVQYQETCKIAASRGIIINTIQCGADPSTADIWQQIARAAEGEYLAIAQDGAVAVIETPFDARLAELGTELGQTVVGYGDAATQAAQAARREVAGRLDDAAPAPSSAERAVYNASAAGASNLLGRQELVRAVQDGTVKIEDIPDEQLPENMRDMNVQQRAEYVEQQAVRRGELQTQINEIARQRQAFLDEARAQAAGEGGFDQQVIRTLRRQAARFGINYKEMGSK